jgi:SAM-dependent MidA family methyltransferase
MTLRHKIEHEIREHGPIPFSRYMELCLYDPELGYYSRTAGQFGKAGDFYTSSDVHAVFGRLLARQFEEMWRVLGSPASITLKELGPGRGLFAQDVLDWSQKKFPDFFGALRYLLVERSPALRGRIEQTLARHLESGKAELVPAPEPGSPDLIATSAAERKQSRANSASRGSGERDDQVPEVGKKPSPTDVTAPKAQTILFANEFFDSLPVEILSDQGSLRLDLRDGRLTETWAPVSPEELEFLDRYSVHPEPGERVEVPLIAQEYVYKVANNLNRGFLIVVDYGYTREEQLAGRHRGTLKAIRQHSVSTSPYEAPGEQDITADVNFSALAAVAREHDMRTQKLLTQSQFLMGVGEASQFADAFEDCRLPQERAKVALQLKHLVTPAGMGESFHVLVASKGVQEESASALSGLSFGRNAPAAGAKT